MEVGQCPQKWLRVRNIGGAQTPYAVIPLGYKPIIRKHNPFVSFRFGLRGKKRKGGRVR